jgi:hypothetical protein
VPDHRPLGWGLSLHREADQLPVERDLVGSLHGDLSDEVGLVEPHRPLVVEPPRGRVEVRILPDDECPLEPQLEQGFEAVRLNLQIGSQLEQSSPERHRVGRVVVQLIRDLAQ